MSFRAAVPARGSKALIDKTAPLPHHPEKSRRKDCAVKTKNVNPVAHVVAHDAIFHVVHPRNMLKFIG
jgi:hypothetical protein